jgi:sugar phosphate isomerase/epimerase
MMRDLANLTHCSINTATLGFSKSLSEKVEAVARAGFGHISPWRRECEGHDIKKLAKQIRDSKLQVPGYYRSTFLPAVDETGRRAAIDDNKRAMDDAIILGAEYFPLVVGSMPSGSKHLNDARKQVINALPELLAYGKRNGIKLAIEPLHPVYAADRSCILTTGQALDICDAVEGNVREPSLGVLLDVYHIWWDPALTHEIARAGSQHRIFGFHVNDWLLETKDPLNDRGMMGDGVIDIRGIRGLVEATGYAGPVEVEIFSAQDWWTRSMDDVLRITAARLASAA